MEQKRNDYSGVDVWCSWNEEDGRRPRKEERHESEANVKKGKHLQKIDRGLTAVSYNQEVDDFVTV